MSILQEELEKYNLLLQRIDSVVNDSEHLNIVNELINTSALFRLGAIRHKSVLTKFYLVKMIQDTLSCNNQFSEQICNAIFEIAKSYEQLNIAMLPIRLVECVFKYDSICDETLAIANYLEGKFFNNLGLPLNAEKYLNKALELIKRINPPNNLIISDIYSEMGRAYSNNPIKTKKRSIEFFQKALEIKNNQKLLPFSIARERINYINSYQLTNSTEELIDENLRFLSERSFSKHYYASYHYPALAYKTNDKTKREEFFGKSLDILLLDYENNNNIYALTYLCTRMARFLYDLERYHESLDIYKICEKLYNHWEEIDYNDLAKLYEMLWNCYIKLNDQKAAKIYRNKSHKQTGASAMITTATQYAYINSDNLQEYLLSCFVAELHKNGYGKWSVHDHTKMLINLTIQALKKIEKSDEVNRTFNECLGQVYFEIGRIFSNNSYNVIPDTDVSSIYFEKASSLGSVPAKLALVMQQESELVNASDNIAELLKLGYEQGDHSMGFSLGLFTMDQKGRIEYFKSAAKAGNAEAQYQLGLIYRDSHNMENNMIQAVDLWEKAAKQNNADALVEMGLVFSSNRILYDLGVEQYDFSAVREPNMEKAFKCFLQAAKRNNIRAQFMLGQVYLFDLAHKNLSEAEFWLSKAANSETPLPMAMLLLARLYTDKNDLTFYNYENALLWYNKIIDTFSESENQDERKLSELASSECEHFKRHNSFLAQHSRPATWDESDFVK